MKNVKKFIPLLGAIPFILGSLGYYMAGVPFADALYGAFTLYFSSPSAEGYNGLIEAARWTAPATTITAFAYLLRSAWEKLTWFVKSRAKDSIAVYAEADFSIEDYAGKPVIYAGKRSFQRQNRRYYFLRRTVRILNFMKQTKSSFKIKKYILE